MLNSDAFDRDQRRNAERRREFIKQWARFVRTHEDAEWSRQQNKLIDSQLRTANDLAAAGSTDPERFFERRDRREA